MNELEYQTAKREGEIMQECIAIGVDSFTVGGRKYNKLDDGSYEMVDLSSRDASTHIFPTLQS